MHDLTPTTEEPIRQAEQRPVVYRPPTQERIEKFAYAVCKQLGQRRDADYCDTSTVQEFTAFVKTIVRIKTKQMNAKGNHDDPSATRA